MSVAPTAGIVDLDTFLPPTAGQNGVQGQVPQPLAGQQDYVLTASGWVPLSSLGTLVYQGTWDASTNTPTLTSSVGTNGYYYVVSVAGNTNLNGITTWTVGDWALFNGNVWQKIEGGSTVDITGGQINNTVIGNNVPAAGTFTTLTATGTSYLGGSSTSRGVQVDPVAGGTTQYTQFSRAVAINEQQIIAAATANLGLVATGGGTINFWTSTTGEKQFVVSRTASAVNYVQVTGAATANPPVLSAQGSDSTIAMLYQAKGGQDHRFFSNSGSAEQFRVLHTAGTIANQTYVTGAVAGASPIFGVRGSDTNIDLALTPKGTGRVKFGTYTASVLAATGYIEIVDAGGTIRRLLVG